MLGGCQSCKRQGLDSTLVLSSSRLAQHRRTIPLTPGTRTRLLSPFDKSAMNIREGPLFTLLAG